MDTYIIDTNIIIDLKKFNPLVFISLWNNIYAMLKNNIIYSVPEVHRELVKTDDSLNEKWEKLDNKYGFFVDLSDKTNAEEYWDVMRELENYEIFQKYGENKVNWADPYIISAAKVDDSIVVTNETTRTQPKRKIPYVCGELDIPCMTLDEFMIYNGWKW